MVRRGLVWYGKVWPGEVMRGEDTKDFGDPALDRLIKVQEVTERVGIGRSSMYKLMRTGGFPLPLKLGGRAVRWSVVELDAWVTAQPRARGDHPP